MQTAHTAACVRARMCVCMLQQHFVHSAAVDKIVYSLQYMHTNINKLMLTSFAAVPEPCGPMSLTCVPMHCITGSTLAKVA